MARFELTGERDKEYVKPNHQMLYKHRLATLCHRIDQQLCEILVL